MSTQRRRSLALCLLLVSSTFLAAFAPLAAADSRILLDLSDDQVVLIQGDSANVTLTIENNDTSIQDFDLTVDDSMTSAAWNVTLADETLSTVLPTFSVTTTIIVHLASDANLSDNGYVDINVAHSGSNVSTTVTLYLSVAPSYLPDIEHTAVGDAGLLGIEVGESIEIDVPISNLGSSIDHIVLAVDETADLSDFWANWNGGGGSNNTGGNNSGNNTGGNNSSGNNTGGNNSGNNTGGNLSQVWSTPVTLDSTYDVGEQSSLAIDSNGNLHVTYLDYTFFNLEYMTYDGSSWSTPVSLDSTDDVGWQSSLAIDSNDNLHVTYGDLTNDDLEYMTYDGSSWSTPVSLDSTDDVGAMSSLAIDSNDHLHVTYLDYTNGNLEYMTYDGSSWSSPVTLDSRYNVGYYSSLAIDSNDNLHVTYQDEVYDNLEYVTYDGSSWSSPVTLDSTDDLGYYTSLAIDSNDNLHVTYLDYTNYNLEYMTYDGSSWSTPVSLDSTDDVGWQSSLAIDSNDNLHVTYLDNTNHDLEYMTYDGSSWSTPVSLDSTDNVGSYSSLAIDSNDNLHVTYYDRTNENLEYMFSSNSAGGNNTTNGTGNVTTGPTEFFASLSAVSTNLTAVLDAVNLTANLTYFVDWVLEENGSIFPYDVGVYNWTSAGTNHSWNQTWNVTAGEWCISATLTQNLSAIGNATTCMTVSSGQSGGGNGTNMGRAVPAGWEVRWMSSTLSNMSAGETRAGTLRVSVPNGEAPGDYGFLLSAGSAMGNFTISETIVVRVNGTHNLTISATDSTNNWLPNGTGMVDFEVHNSGTSESESIYTISTSGVCSASLDSAEADGSRLGASDNETITVDVSIDVDAGEGETCDLTLDAWDEIAEMGYSHTHALVVGVSHGLEVVSNEALSLTPGGSTSGVITIRNTGSEATNMRLSASSDDLTIDTSSTFVTVDSGETVDLSWSTSAASDTPLVGNYTIDLSAETQDGSATLNFSGVVSIEPWSSIWMTGPLGGAFDVGSDEPESVDFTLTNDGTGAANAALDWSGAPQGFTITVSNGASVAPNGNSSILSMTVGIDDDIASGTYTFTILAMNPDDGSTWDSMTINAQVDQRAEVRVLVAGDSLPVASGADSVFAATVINDGNEPDTFAITLTGAAGFEVGISPQTLTLASGESGEVNITLRRTGASEDVEMTLIVESENDDSITDSLSLFATVPEVSVQATVTTNEVSIPAEGSASLTLFLSNLGEAEDTLLVTGPSGFSCNHPAQTTLAAGSAAESHAVTCNAGSNLLAGTHTIAFTVTSLTDSNANSTDSVDIQIDPHRNTDGGPVLEVAMTGDDWSLPWNSSATYTVTVRNDGNELVSGFLNIAGEHEQDLLRFWNLDVNQSVGMFTVAPGGVATYMLTLQPSGEPTIGTLDFRIEATGTLTGQGFLVSSQTSSLSVEFEPPVPTEAELWNGGPMVNAANLAIAMLTGWIFAGLLILWVRYSSKSRAKKSAQDAWDEAAEEENKDADLSHGEIRADEDGTARCHACDSRIRLPTDKEAPFRFKCPTCEEMNRVMPPREED